MEPLLHVPAAADFLHTPEATLRFWRSRGVGPVSFKVGRRVVYRQSDLADWLDEQRAAAERARAAAV